MEIRSCGEARNQIRKTLKKMLQNCVWGGEMLKYSDAGGSLCPHIYADIILVVTFLNEY